MVKETVRNILVPHGLGLDSYQSLEPQDSLREVSELGKQVSSLLGTRRVFMLNSTEAGGGVAEMMPRLCALLNALGVHTRWLVLTPDGDEFFRVTKGLHRMLHGEPGLSDLESAQEIYRRYSHAAADRLRDWVEKDDLLIVHDPQPLGVAALIGAPKQPLLVWRCHIGVPFENQDTHRAWSFLRQYLAPYSRLLFSADRYIPQEHRSRSGVLYPSIDPLSQKNRELEPREIAAVMNALGLVDGRGTADGWIRFQQRATVFAQGSWAERPIDGLLEKPAIVQVSRFDWLKGFQYLIPAFARLVGASESRRISAVREEQVAAVLENVQLVLAGPDPSGVPDDPEAAATLKTLCEQQAALPPEIRPRVHLVRLPMSNRQENALGVNALQRLATVVVQNSLREGFGLTATEALWKGVPVVAANVGGLSEQIRHGVDGLLVNEPDNPAAVAEGLLQILACPKKAQAMAWSGKNRVRERFLVVSQIRRWLEEFKSLLLDPTLRAVAA